MAKGLFYGMIPEKMKLDHAWVSTGHFCREYEYYRLRRNWLSILDGRGGKSPSAKNKGLMNL